MLPPYLRLRRTARVSRIQRTARFVEGRFAAVMLAKPTCSLLVFAGRHDRVLRAA